MGLHGTVLLFIGCSYFEWTHFSVVCKCAVSAHIVYCHMLVSRHGGWFDNWIYWTFITYNYKYEGGWEVFDFIKKITSYRIKKVYLLYILHPELHTHSWFHCSNFFNPSKKNYFGCASNHPSASFVASAVLGNCLPLRCFLSLRKIK